MRVGIIDVGSNTARLLVADAGDAGLSPVRTERAALGLGSAIERSGRIPRAKLEETAAAVAGFARAAREAGAEIVEALVTSPGRQAENGEALVAIVERAARAPAWQLTGEDEGRLAYEGAVAAEGVAGIPVAVCDVGGGSTQLAVGDEAEAGWVRTVDIGSLRLTRRALRSDPPGPEALEAAVEEARRLFADVKPPGVEIALAVGGSARALRRLTGRLLDTATLADAAERLAKRPSRELVKELGVDAARARTLVAGAVILGEVERRLEVPLRVARGGVREGAALRLVRYAAAA